MKASCNWLRELVRVEASDREIAERLTAAGLEIEGEARVGAGVAGVIVAEVRESRRHPKAEKLTLVDVWDGREVTQVVCGASNVPAPGGRVAWARPGATLPGGITLAAKEVRGILSPGMLCAEDELGLSEEHAGIVILDEHFEPGADVAHALGLPDTILEVNVTPNRPDCLGHFGLAREIAALFPGSVMQPLETSLDLVIDSLTHTKVEELADVELVDVEGCPRYSARVLTDVEVGKSPLRVRLRLQSLGVRSINDVVDATNLGLLENGHPLHAFDLDRLAGRRVIVRRARAGEPIVTLDGQERRLTVEDVAICDTERPVAVAGVMGGRDSEVTGATTRLLLESAHFQGARIRRTGRRLGLSSEASQRFERGTDPNAGVEVGSLRCARRIAGFTGGRVAHGVIDRYPNKIEPLHVTLRPSRARKLLGIELSGEEQGRILGALGLEPRVSEAAIDCAVPTFRPDLTREVDLVEEIVRVHGYDRVPATLPRTTVPPSTEVDRIGRAAEAARDAMAGLGFAETISFAFVAPERIAAMGFGDWRGAPLKLQNPLREEQSALRTSLLPGLLGALKHNLARGVGEVRLFEVGTVFRAQTSGAPGERGDGRLPTETWRVAGVLCGHRSGWLKAGVEYDFFDVKGLVDGLLARARVQGIAFRAPLRDRAAAGEGAWLHPGQGAVLLEEDAVVGAVGEVHPEVRDRLGLEARCLAFEIDLAPLAAAPLATFAELPRFPGSARDLSFFVEDSVPADEMAAAMAAASPLAESVRALEDYREAGRVPAGKKGMLWSIVYRSREKTLTDDEVNREHARVIEALRAKWPIEQR